MARLAFAVFAALLVACLAPDGVAAWNCGGHMLTAMVALSRSSQEVRDALQPYFAYMQNRWPEQSVNAELACWPDDVKDITYAFSSWHYQDTCYNPTGSPTCPSEPDGHLWEALNRSRLEMPLAASSASDRAFWLSFLIHLVGDAHQPMHVCTLFRDPEFPNGDLGGNRFKLFFNGSWDGLHHMCDDGLNDLLGGNVPRPVVASSNYWSHMQTVEQALRQTEAITDAEAADLSYDSWAAEGFSLCKRYGYLDGTLRNGSTVNSTYVDNLHRMLRRRVVLGGARLATLLENAVRAMKANDAANSAGDTAGKPTNKGRVAAIIVSVLIAIVITALVVAAFVKRGASRRRHVVLIDDMPYDRPSTTASYTDVPPAQPQTAVPRV